MPGLRLEMAINQGPPADFRVPVVEWVRLLWSAVGTTLNSRMRGYLKIVVWLCLLGTAMTIGLALCAEQKKQNAGSEPSASVKTSPQRLVIGRESDTITVRGSRIPVVTLRVLEASGMTQEQPSPHPGTQSHARSTQVSPREDSYQTPTTLPSNCVVLPSPQPTQKDH